MRDSDDSDTSPMVAGIDDQSNNNEEQEPLMVNIGPMTRVGRDENHEPTFRFLSRGQDAANAKLEEFLIVFLLELQHKVYEHIPEKFLPIYTGHQCSGVMF